MEQNAVTVCGSIGKHSKKMKISCKKGEKGQKTCKMLRKRAKNGAKRCQVVPSGAK
jgi:hypothetical protein